MLNNWSWNCLWIAEERTLEYQNHQSLWDQGLIAPAIIGSLDLHLAALQLQKTWNTGFHSGWAEQNLCLGFYSNSEWSHEILCQLNTSTNSPKCNDQKLDLKMLQFLFTLYKYTAEDQTQEPKRLNKISFWTGYTRDIHNGLGNRVSQTEKGWFWLWHKAGNHTNHIICFYFKKVTFNLFDFSWISTT